MLSPLGRLCQIFAECQHHPEGPSRGVQSQLCSTETTHQQAACWETPQTFTGFFKYAWEPHQRVPEVSLPCSYRTCRGWCNYTGIHAAMATCASHWSSEMRVIKIQITADINFSIPQGFVWLSPALTLILFPILLCSGFAFTLSPSWGCAGLCHDTTCLFLTCGKGGGNCLPHRRCFFKSMCLCPGMDMEMNTPSWKGLSHSLCFWPQEKGQQRKLLEHEKGENISVKDTWHSSTHHCLFPDKSKFCVPIWLAFPCVPSPFSDTKKQDGVLTSRVISKLLYFLFRGSQQKQGTAFCTCQHGLEH